MHQSESQLLSISLIFCSVVFCSSAFAHSGGTDSNGCHSGSEPYHCHTPKSDRSSASPRTSVSPRSSGSSQSSGSPRSSGLIMGTSPGSPSNLPDVPFDLKSASGLSEEKYQSNADCKRFTFSEILGQADRGSVDLHCGQVIMSIQAH